MDLRLENTEAPFLTPADEKDGLERSEPVEEPSGSSAATEEFSSSFRSPLPMISEKPSLKPKETSSFSNLLIGTKESQAAVTTSANHEEPPWASFPRQIYSLEVLKNGVVVDNISLSLTKSSYTIGRLPGQCDICSEHPSSSRFHAVLQHGRMPEDPQEGFYLYDLSSTHGTFLNKIRLPAQTFVRLKVGYVIRFGQSTRLYILQGPPEDADEDSGLTISQIKELQARNLEDASRKRQEDKGVKEPEDSGVDWGFGPDATEEEGGDEKGVGLLGMTFSSRDAYYADDPKKALNVFFLREGMDMEHDFEEIGHGNKKQYLCRIPLPIDAPNGRQLVAEATANRKKDALAQAMLEACRLLHAQGALKGTTSIGRRQKGKNWADEDFYDSDEDTYTDRTGTVERKRQQRIQRMGKQDTKVETFESLTSRLDALKTEVEEITTKLQKADKNKSDSIGAGGLDDLDSFMDAIKLGLIMDPKTKIKLKQRLAELKQEEMRLIKIINLIKPLDLPAIQPTLARTAGVAATSTGRLKAPTLPASAAPIYNHDVKEDFVVEEEDLEDNSVVQAVLGDVGESGKESVTPTSSGKRLVRHEDLPTIALEGKDLQPALETDVSRPYIQPDQPKKRKYDQQKRQRVEYDPSDPDYAMWIPPEDQAGDGKTTLNERLGY